METTTTKLTLAAIKANENYAIELQKKHGELYRKAVEMQYKCIDQRTAIKQSVK